MLIEHFGTLADGSSVRRYTLRNASGMSAQILDYGCILSSLCVPDRFGSVKDVVQGYDRLEYYAQDITLCGALVGRHANRIAYGRFSLDGREYRLPCTYDVHHMHGGQTGFQRRLFEYVPEENPLRLTLARCSPDGEEGYPGNLEVTVRYELTEDNKLLLSYAARCDQPTPVNLTNHSYFNLSGDLCSSILSHRLWLASESFVESDSTGLPAGGRPVEGTPFDFRAPALIGDRLAIAHPQTRQVGGYDQYFPAQPSRPGGPSAMLYSPDSGICLCVYSDQPGLQLYSSNRGFSLPGKEGKVYPRHSALCLESQHIANSMNIDGFPSSILPANTLYRQDTIWEFGIGERDCFYGNGARLSGGGE
ncbi:MAG: aldose epimerase family protein [Bacillota bacterium]